MCHGSTTADGGQLRGTPDRELVKQATAIVVASALTSHTELNAHNTIETVTAISVEEVLKGSVPADVFDIMEPGGVYEQRVTTIPGVPRFTDGERYLLFLFRTDEGVWRVFNLVLGKFTFQTDTLGHEVAIRDAAEIAGWDPDGKPHQEEYRSSAQFIDFIRASATGGPAREDYFIPAQPLIEQPTLHRRLKAQTDRVLQIGMDFTSTSYTYIYSGSSGARWNTFPSTVTFFTTGANAAAITATNNGLNAWTNDGSSNVVLGNGGVDASGTHTGGLLTPDGQNTVAFEVNLTSKYGASGFTCGGSSYSGLLGVGGVTTNVGSHTGPNGEMFFSATEGDVDMNQGLQGCTFFVNAGGGLDFSSAVAHEIGHTLGFRHADTTRPATSSTSCSGDVSLECSTSAIMKTFINTGLMGALQLWDRNAVAAVYPAVAINPPTNVIATATTSTNVQVSWTAAAGATSYHVYRSENGTTYSQVGNPGSSPFNDPASTNKAYLYKVRSFNGAESADSNRDLATVVIFTDGSLTGVVVKAVHLTQLRTAVNAVRTLANIGAGSYTDPTITAMSTVIKAAHITELRTQLNAARSTLTLTAAPFNTDPTITAMSTTIKAGHITELRSGVQ